MHLLLRVRSDVMIPTGASMSYAVGLPNNSYKPITNMPWVRAQHCKLQENVHSTCSRKVIKFTSCLPMIGGSLRVFQLLTPLKLVAMI